MFKTLTLTSLALAGAVTTLAPTPATAMEICRERHEIADLLTNQRQEQHFASGLQASVQLIELWVSDETGTWSILVTKPDGMSCLVASGTSWTEQLMQPAGLPS